MRLFTRARPRTPAAGVVVPAEAATLSEPQQRVLDDLQSRGIATIPFDELFADGDLWAAMKADMDEFVSLALQHVPRGMVRPERKDQFLVRRWRADKTGKVLEQARLSTDGPWLRFAASDKLLEIVDTYRGVKTKLVDIDCWYTVPFPEAHERVASQRWHRDPEDLNVVKCFVYFSDVDQEAGPFEYIPGSTTGGPYGDLWAWGESEGWYPPEEVIDARVPASDRVLLTGPAGTVVLCDTSGFHRGGHATARPRILETHTYVSPRSTWGRRFEVEWGDGDLSERATYALG
jgi:hypothetical protein